MGRIITIRFIVMALCITVASTGTKVTDEVKNFFARVMFYPSYCASGTNYVSKMLHLSVIEPLKISKNKQGKLSGNT